VLISRGANTRERASRLLLQAVVESEAEGELPPMGNKDKTFMKSGFDVTGDLEYTTDHKMIRNWAGRWHGHPAVTKSDDVGTAESGRTTGGSLRIRFPKDPDEKSLQSISWDEFFRRFEEQHLALEYLDEPRNQVKGRPFARLVDRGTVQADSQALADLSEESQHEPE
jgi:hypothetical protein